jgi:hypothetical protein
MPTTELLASSDGRRRPMTDRDRDAEAIRAVLRRNGHPEFGRPGDGFYVDGGYNGGPFLVSCATRSRHRRLSPTAEVAGYTTALEAAGMHVEPQTGPDASPIILHVRPAPPSPAHHRFR